MAAEAIERPAQTPLTPARFGCRRCKSPPDLAMRVAAKCLGIKEIPPAGLVLREPLPEDRLAEANEDLKRRKMMG